MIPPAASFPFLIIYSIHPIQELSSKAEDPHKEKKYTLYFFLSSNSSILSALSFSLSLSLSLYFSVYVFQQVCTPRNTTSLRIIQFPHLFTRTPPPSFFFFLRKKAKTILEERDNYNNITNSSQTKKHTCL